jgi:dolichol kinase
MNQLELRRQLIHATGIFVAILIREVYKIFQGWLVPASLLLVIIFVGYGISYLHRGGVKLPILTRIIRDSERDKDKEFPGRGALRFFMGSFFTLLIFRNSPAIVVAGIIVLALGDSASTLGGVAFGRHKLFYNHEKSIEGTLSGLIAAFLGLMILTQFSLELAVIASLVGVIVESLPLGVDDNLTVPVAAGFSIWILSTTIII